MNINTIIPPGASKSAAKRPKVDAFIEDARFKHPESLQDRVARTKKNEEQKDKLIAAFNEYDTN